MSKGYHNDGGSEMAVEKTMDKIVALCKSRGFIFQDQKFTEDLQTHGITVH